MHGGIQPDGTSVVNFMALTLLEERILNGVRESVPLGVVEPVAPGATSAFSSVIRMTVTEDITGTNPLCYLFTAPPGKNTEDPDGGRMEKLAWTYGLWLRQDDESFTAAFHGPALPYIAAETNLAYPIAFDEEPEGCSPADPGCQQILWSPPYMEDVPPTPGPLAATVPPMKRKKAPKNMKTFIICRWWNDFIKNRGQRVGRRVFQGRRICGGGSAFLCLVGSAAAVAIAYLVAPVALQALRLIGGNPCGEAKIVGDVTNIPDCSTTVCADGIQRGNYAGFIYTIESARCGIYKINTCCDTVETIEEPIEPFPWTTVALVVGGVAALAIIAAILSRDKKKPGDK